MLSTEDLALLESIRQTCRSWLAGDGSGDLHRTRGRHRQQAGSYRVAVFV
jgi:hypothetical protein